MDKVLDVIGIAVEGDRHDKSGYYIIALHYLPCDRLAFLPERHLGFFLRHAKG